MMQLIEKQKQKCWQPLVSFFSLGQLFIGLLLILYQPLLLAKEAAVDYFYPVVVAKLPHDPQAFTQGLALEGTTLYESTGLYGQSSLRLLDLSTGHVLQKQLVASHFFAEGLAVFPSKIIQLTWREKQALLYSRPFLKLAQTLSYQGEGWGLCRDEETVWMSNGTATLVQRVPDTFAILKSVVVQWNGQPVSNLNDLECVGEILYANVWYEDWILKIDKFSGQVMGVINASQLLTAAERASLRPGSVLNGIAFRPETNTFFLTGKFWPWIFEVRLQKIPAS